MLAANENNHKRIFFFFFSRKMDASVTCEQFHRQSKTDLTFYFNKRTCDLHLQEVSNESYDQD